VGVTEVLAGFLHTYPNTSASEVDDNAHVFRQREQKDWHV